MARQLVRRRVCRTRPRRSRCASGSPSPSDALPESLRAPGDRARGRRGDDRLDLQPRRALRRRRRTRRRSRRCGASSSTSASCRRACARTSTPRRRRRACATCSASPRRSTRWWSASRRSSGRSRRPTPRPLDAGHARAGPAARLPRAFALAKRVRTETDVARSLGVDRLGGGRSGGADLRRSRRAPRARRRRRQDGRSVGAPPEGRGHRRAQRRQPHAGARGRAGGAAGRHGGAVGRARPAARARSTSCSARRARREPILRRDRVAQGDARAQGALALLHRHRRAARRRARGRHARERLPLRRRRARARGGAEPRAARERGRRGGGDRRRPSSSASRSTSGRSAWCRRSRLCAGASSRSRMAEVERTRGARVGDKDRASVAGDGRGDRQQAAARAADQAQAGGGRPARQRAAGAGAHALRPAQRRHRRARAIEEAWASDERSRPAPSDSAGRA